MNIIMDNYVESNFAKKLSNTLLSSFWKMYFRWITPNNQSYYDNFIVTNQKLVGFDSFYNYTKLWIYTDNINTLEIDKYNLFYTHKQN
jgi:hypothetical protein